MKHFVSLTVLFVLMSLTLSWLGCSGCQGESEDKEGYITAAWTEDVGSELRIYFTARRKLGDPLFWHRGDRGTWEDKCRLLCSDETEYENLEIIDGVVQWKLGRGKIYNITGRASLGLGEKTFSASHVEYDAKNKKNK